MQMMSRVVKSSIIRIGKPAYSVTKSVDSGTAQKCLRVEIDYPQRQEVSLSLSLRLKCIFLYTAGILFHMECCIRQLWCTSIISYNITSISITNILISTLFLFQTYLFLSTRL